MQTKGIKYFIVTISLFLLLPAIPAQAQQVHAYARLDTAAINIGDQIGLTLGIDLPKGFQVQWPVLNDTLAPHVEVISRGKVDSIPQKNLLKMQQKLVITSFDSGTFDIKAFVFQFKNQKDGQTFKANTNLLTLRVYSPQVDTTKAFKPIKAPVAEPYTLGEILPWALLVLALIGGVIFLIWYLKKRKNHEPVFARKPKPVLPPHEEAIKKLEELRLSRLWQAGKIKAYHSAITDIMRQYFTRRFGFDALEMTSDEVMENLEDKKVNAEALQKIREVFQLADLVKFAKAAPTAVENDISLNYCIDFVNETKTDLTGGEVVDDKKEEGK